MNQNTERYDVVKYAQEIIASSHRMFPNRSEATQMQNHSYFLAKHFLSEVEAREKAETEIKNYSMGFLHTCHEQCQKIECIQRRRILELEAEIERLKIENANGKEAMELMRWINQKNPGVVTMAIGSLKENAQ